MPSPSPGDCELDHVPAVRGQLQQEAGQGECGGRLSAGARPTANGGVTGRRTGGGAAPCSRGRPRRSAAAGHTAAAAAAGGARCRQDGHPGTEQAGRPSHLTEPVFSQPPSRSGTPALPLPTRARLLVCACTIVFVNGQACVVYIHTVICVRRDGDTATLVRSSLCCLRNVFGLTMLRFVTIRPR